MEIYLYYYCEFERGHSYSIHPEGHDPALIGKNEILIATRTVENWENAREAQREIIEHHRQDRN